MLGIEIISKGKFLRLDPQTKIKISLRNAAYLGNSNDYSTDVIPTAFSFPTEITLDAYNMALLSHPQKIDNAVAFLNDEPVRIWAKGIVIFDGSLTVRNVKGSRCNFEILVSTISGLKNKQLNTLTLDTFGTTVPNIASDAKATIQTPDNYNYIFCPVWNHGIYGDEPDDLAFNAAFQNCWNATSSTAGGFLHSDGEFQLTSSAGLTPHPKLKHVLEKMFTEEGFSLDNQFQNTRELNWLLVYSNYSVLDISGTFGVFPAQISNGLSSQKRGVFLRNICRRFALAPFVNFFTKEAFLKPFSTLQNAGVAANWTNIAIVRPRVMQDNRLPSRFRDKVSDNILPDMTKTFSTIDSHVGALKEGYYDIDGYPLYFNYDKNILTTAIFDDYLTTTGKDAEYDNEFGLLPFAKVISNTIECRAVALKQKCTRPYGGTLKVEPNENRLFFYRGLTETTADKLYPYGSCADKDLEGNTIKVGFDSAMSQYGYTGYAFTPFDAEYSLHWTGAKGLYEKWWKGNFEFIENAKTVMFSLNPSWNDILSFSFDQKIAIKNMVYFVKRLDVTIDSAGNITEGEAEMLTTV